VDAPVSGAMTRKDFEEHYRAMYGEESVTALPSRLERADRYGTSLMDRTSAEEAIRGNRAGAGETELFMKQIVEFYCRNGGIGEVPIGKDRAKDSEESC
jgi:hypothetical protein